MARNNFTKSLLVLLLIGFISNYTEAQPFKVGKIKADDFLAMPYEKDPEASAVFLYDYGITKMKYSGGQGSFYYTYERSFRMQIINEDGLDWADLEVPLYNSSRGRESILKFKAYVHNLEGGKVKSTKLKRRSPIIEETSDNIKTWKITFPEVRPGSIIEIRYTLKSPYIYSLSPWQFQYSVPVEYSEYETRVLEFYNFRTYLQGYELINSTNTNFVNESIHIGGQVIQARSRQQKWIMKDVKALKEEPYTNNIRNYVSKIYFELESIIWPGGAPQLYVTSWADVDKRLRESDYFGKYMEGSRKLRNEVEELSRDDQSENEKIAAAIKYLHENVRWNSRTGKFASEKPSKIIKDGTGNAADINLMLISILNEMGFKAYPVISSTRKNGLVIQAFPTMSRLNYVIAAVETKENGLLLLDATDKYCPIGMLPKRVMNGSGRLLKENSAEWIDLTPTVKAEQICNYTVFIDDNASFSGNGAITNKEYSSYLSRSEILELNDDDKYLENLVESITGINIQSHEIENREEVYEPLIEKIDFTLNEGIQKAGDLIMFHPLLMERIEENPFNPEERVYPIDFTVPIREELSFVFNIPEGYIIDFIPENDSYTIRNFADYSFSTNINENGQIEVNSIFEIKTHLVTADMYAGLRAFFTKVVEKQSEQIVLKAEL